MVALKTNEIVTVTVRDQPAAAAIIILAFLSICSTAGPIIGAGDSEYNNANIALKEIVAFP